MLELPDCTLCEHKADPRYGATIGTQFFWLCDGCPPSPNEDQVAFFERLKLARVQAVAALSGISFWPRTTSPTKETGR